MSRIHPQESYRRDWLLQTTYTALQQFVQNELANHAAATAFYFLLSAAPLVLLLTYGTQLLAHLAETSQLATVLLAALYDQFQLERLATLGLIPQKAAYAASGLGLLTLLLSSRGLVNAMQSAFRVIFPDEAKRHFLFSWILPLIIIPVAFGLIGLTVTLHALINFLASVEMLGSGRSLLYLNLNRLLELTLLWGLIYLTLHRMPLRHPPLFPSFVVSGLATFSLIGLYLGFGYFYQIEKYRAIYGALGGVVFILIGVYLACMAFFFWSQFLYAWSKVDVAALERLFLGGAGGLESLVFARSNRLLARYGQTFADGEFLIREGDASREVYFLHAGKAGLYKRQGDQENRLGELGVGEMFGEMAYILQENRTASIRAEGEVTVLVLPPEMLEELMRYSAPLSRRIVASLAGRLMRMNQTAKG